MLKINKVNFSITLKSILGLSFVLVTGNAHASIKEKIKESFISEVVSYFVSLPGLSNIIEAQDNNRISYVTNAEDAGRFIVENPDSMKSLSLSPKKDYPGFKYIPLMQLTPGKYWLRTEPKDESLSSIERWVEIRPNETTEFNLEFWSKGKEYFPLKITTEPSGAVIKVMSISPKYSYGMQLKSVPSGYPISITLKGYKKVSERVHLGKNQTEFHFELEKLP